MPTPAEAFAQAKREGKSLFESNPLMAIGVLLQSLGTEGGARIAGIKKDAAALLEKDRVERGRVFQRARDTQAFVATVAEQLKDIPEEMHDAVIGPAVARITASLGGDEKLAASLRQEILALRQRPEAAAKLREQSSFIEHTKMAIGHAGVALGVFPPKTRGLFLAGLERTKAANRIEEDGRTIYEISLPLAIPALEAIGQFKYTDAELAVASSASAAHLFAIGTERDTGNEAFVRFTDPRLDVITAEAVAGREPAVAAGVRAEEVARGKARGEPRKSAFVDDLGNLTVTAGNSLRQETAAIFGGLYDPTTGTFSALDPKSRRRAQEITARAAELLRTGKAASVPEAVQAVLDELGLREEFTAEGRIPPTVAAPEGAVKARQTLPESLMEDLGKVLGISTEEDAEPPEPGDQGFSRDDPVPVQTREEAEALPTGTWFKTPGGRVLRRSGS